MFHKRLLLAFALVWVVVLAACSDVEDSTGSDTTDPTDVHSTAGVPTGSDSDAPDADAAFDVEFVNQLTPAGECDALLSWLKDEGAKRVGAYGLPGVTGPYGYGMEVGILESDAGSRIAMDDQAADESVAAQGGVPDATVPAMAPTPPAASAADRDAGTASASKASEAYADDGGVDFAPVEGEDYSVTNVQEQGVDEPDIVKTNGKVLITARDGHLYVVGLGDDTLDELADLKLPGDWGHELFLSGERLLVMGRSSQGSLPVAAERNAAADSAYWGGGNAVTVMVEYDISDPSEPKKLGTLEIDGNYLTARMVDGVVRLVSASMPTGLAFETPTGAGLRGEREAIRANREVIEASELADWLPYYVYEDKDGDVSEGTLIDCERAYRPDLFSGFGLLSVVTVDLAGDGLAPTTSAGVFAGGQTVYASPESLFVASERWIDWDNMSEADARRATERALTDIHEFDIANPGAAAEYVGGGAVVGTLLNQFSMSEYDDDLRVVTTTRNWNTGATTSTVRVLSRDDGALVEVGQVGGLGRGEEVQSVRFIGDRGYVVTFRQVDPLYVIDLSDPTNPTVEGELKIEGFSSYLHPIGDNLLVGVGTDATMEGRRTGAQIALFDVSDAKDPKRVDKISVDDGNVNTDHRAFLYWAPTSMAFVPIEQWSSTDTGYPRLELFAIQIDTEAGTLAKKGAMNQYSNLTDVDGDGKVTMSDVIVTPTIERTVIANGAVITVGPLGVALHDGTTFENRAFVETANYQGLGFPMPVEPGIAVEPPGEPTQTTTVPDTAPQPETIDDQIASTEAQIDSLTIAIDALVRGAEAGGEGNDLNERVAELEAELEAAQSRLSELNAQRDEAS